jgi:hypothetical protein
VEGSIILVTFCQFAFLQFSLLYLLIPCINILRINWSLWPLFFIFWVRSSKENPKLGQRLDKFLVSEDLNIKETEVLHISDNFYKTNLSMKKKFNHGAVRLLFNKKKIDVGPGQFKLDPYLVSCGALDSVIKEVIYEANFYNSNVP